MPCAGIIYCTLITARLAHVRLKVRHCMQEVVTSKSKGICKLSYDLLICNQDFLTDSHFFSEHE